jgi:type I restriction enzyme, S subunit
MNAKINQIPKGWKKMNVVDLILPLESGKRPKGGVKGIQSGIPSLGGEHLNYNGNFNFKKIKYVPLDFFKKMNRGKIKSDDILMVKDGATTGKTSFVDNKFPYNDACVNEHVFIIKTKKIILPKFLFHFLRSNYSQNIISEKTRGTIGGINTSFVENFPIIFPENIQTQKNIVKKLDHVLDELEIKKNKVLELHEKNQIKNIIEIIKQDILSKAFLGNLSKKWRDDNPTQTSMDFIKKIQEKNNTNIKNSKNKITIVGKNKQIDSWTDVKLDNLIYISARIGWKGLKKDEYTDTGPLFLSVHNLNFGNVVNLNNTFHIPQWRYDESPQIQLKNDDILLTKDGAGIGKIAMVKNLSERATINSSLLLIRGLEAFIPEFLFYYLKGPAIQKIVQERILGAAIPHLFQKDIRQFILSIPPKQEQIEIVKIIKEKNRELDKYHLKMGTIISQQEKLLLDLNKINLNILDSMLCIKY